MSPLVRRSCGVIALAVSAGLMLNLKAQESAATRNLTLRAEQVSTGPDGRTVVTAAAAGDIRGALTLTITGVNSAGTITSGEWALVNSYIQDVAVSHAPHSGEGTEAHEHPGGELLVNHGTLSGKITGGTLTYDADGKLSALGYVQLSISLGSLTFQSVTSGTASLALTGIQDPARSTGAAAFTF